MYRTPSDNQIEHRTTVGPVTAAQGEQLAGQLNVAPGSWQPAKPIPGHAVSQKSDWQSERAPHAVSSKPSHDEHAFGQAGLLSPGPQQPTKLSPPSQFAQYSGVQPLVSLHVVSVRLSQAGCNEQGSVRQEQRRVARCESKRREDYRAAAASWTDLRGAARCGRARTLIEPGAARRAGTAADPIPRSAAGREGLAALTVGALTNRRAVAPRLAEWPRRGCHSSPAHRLPQNTRPAVLRALCSPRTSALPSRPDQAGRTATCSPGASRTSIGPACCTTPRFRRRPRRPRFRSVHPMSHRRVRPLNRRRPARWDRGRHTLRPRRARTMQRRDRVSVVSSCSTLQRHDPAPSVLAPDLWTRLSGHSRARTRSAARTLRSSSPCTTRRTRVDHRKVSLSCRPRYPYTTP